ncbi:MAG: hypothetical protein DCC88_01250 [Spirobacillus cienkowskii]|jgi:murein L,D-transpeptidase YafK|uniref:L,D-TPase catalytic domain-containing protein n=1 Tax=Spirobacillus cienkowskii TaxID=495820 RepID=A0A369KUC7_9BACT|nr:MAG: hypothetical protein DCC88_01250 [Spirobacillus cienkowskii]
MIAFKWWFNKKILNVLVLYCLIYIFLYLMQARYAEATNSKTQIIDSLPLSQFNIVEASQNSENTIPSSFISLGTKQNSYALVVEKLKHTLSVYKSNEFGSYDLVKTYKAATGKNHGDKTLIGDKKTPEGIYFITGKISGDKLPPKYGPGALILDYPNVFDQRLSKTGYGIWIHGVDDDNRIGRAFDTDGCVALKNQDWLDLEKYILAFETPVVITDQLTLLDSSKELADKRNMILTMLNIWKISWELSDFQTYLNFYSNTFRSDNKNIKKWMKTKENLSFSRKGKINIEILDPKILAYKDQIFISFLQNYSSPEKQDFGRKFLYLNKENNQYKIISEKWIEFKNNSNLVSSSVRQNDYEYNTK